MANEIIVRVIGFRPFIDFYIAFLFFRIIIIGVLSVIIDFFELDKFVRTYVLLLFLTHFGA